MSSYINSLSSLSIFQNQTASLSAIPDIAISALQSIRKILKFDKLILSGNIHYFGKIPASPGIVFHLESFQKASLSFEFSDRTLLGPANNIEFSVFLK